MYTHIKRAIRTAALIGIIVPPTALAAIMLQLPTDAIVGLGFDVLVHGAPKNDAVAIQMHTPDGGSVGLRGKANDAGEAMLTVKGSTTERAGTYAFVADDGATADVEILPDAIDPVLSEINVWTPRIQNDGEDGASITVTLRDQYGNPLQGRIATLVSGRSTDELSAETNQTDENGEQHFILRTFEPGTISLRAIDLLSGIPLADAATVRSGDLPAIGGRDEDDVPVSRMSNGNRFYYAQVSSFDVIDGFEITAPSTLPLDEEAELITIRAVDKNGEAIENYAGTVVFSSTDPNATLPNFGKYTFKPRDLGKKDFPIVLKFKSPGTQTFRVEDQNDRTIFGDVTINVEGRDSVPDTGSITITSPTDGGTVNGTSVTIEGTGPTFTNVIVLGGATDTPGSTDANGRFSIPISLRQDQRDYTIRVQDEDKRYDSGPILLRLDADPPSITSVTFKPEQPEEGEKVLVVMKSEPSLSSAVLTITQRDTNAVQNITLTPTAAEGTYQAFFTAPQPDDYQPRLLVTDAAGNTAELLTTLTIGSPALATVSNVAAEPRVNGVSVRWTEISEGAEKYRVYVGESPASFGYFLDTEQAANRATIAGLAPGKLYYFAVTALQGDRESEKSIVVSAKPQGVSLSIQPNDHELTLQWTTMEADTPLSYFLVEYGLSEDHLTETRLINREAVTATLQDLLNDVEYVVRLTPVTAAGKKLSDLSATARGTPTGELFHPSADDPIPFDLTTHPGELQTSAPETPGSGIPAAFLWSSIAAMIGGSWYQLHRRAERKRTHAFFASLPHA